MFYIIGISVFEYDAGLSDVDWLELLLLSLLLLTSYRLFYRGRQQRWSYWQLLKRFCFVCGIVFLIFLFGLGIFISIFLPNDGAIQINDIHQYKDAQLFSLGALLVLALYAAAPLPPLFKGKQAESETLIDKASQADETISGRGEGFTFKDANEQPDKQTKERVDPWLSEGVAKNSQFNKGV